MSDQSRPRGWDASRSAAGERNPWLVAVIVSIATFMVVLDTAIANVSLRYIAGSLAASVDESTWVVTTYLIANAVVLPASGWLSNVVGRKRFYMICVGLFTISSLFCGLATNLPELIFFRILQGLGGGGMPTSEQAILADTFPPQRRGQAFALYGVAVIVAPTVGPTVGGWITDNFSWHWIFFINVPIGLVSLALVHWFVDEPEALERERKERLADGLKVDWIGFVLIAATLGCLEVVLDRGQIDDWFRSGTIVTFTILAAVSFLAFIPWELSAGRSDHRNSAVVSSPIRHGVFYHADDRRDPVRLEPDHAAAPADDVPVYRHAFRPRHDAGRLGHADRHADRRPGHRPFSAEIPDGLRTGRNCAVDVVLDLAHARRQLRLFRLGARLSDDRAAVPVYSHQYRRL